MTWKTFAGESRLPWGHDCELDYILPESELQLGCIMRIADALERIADLIDPKVQERERVKAEKKAELKAKRLAKMAQKEVVE